MKSAFRTYSSVLQLRRDVIAPLLQTRQGIVYSFKLFVVVLLIAGLGIWFGLPNTLRQPTLTDQIDRVTVEARDVTMNVVARIIPLVTNLKDISQTVTDFLNQYVSPIVNLVGPLSAQLVQPTDNVASLLEQATISTDDIMRLVRTTRVTPEQLGALLSHTDATPEQIRLITLAANLALPEVQRQIDKQIQERVPANVQNAVTQIQPTLQKLSVAARTTEQILTILAATPEQLNQILSILNLTIEQLGQALGILDAAPEKLQALSDQIHTEAVAMEPIAGAAPSRTIRTAGEWLSTPLQFASDWLWFVLLLLLVARAIGGKATVGQHIAASALAVAPAVLLLGAYIPNLTGTIPVYYAVAVEAFGRILALVGIVWAGAILISMLSAVHGFGIWKSIGAVALTIAVLLIVVPLATFLASTYLLIG